ncbi:hypothetical protein [Pontibacillus salipaludis]|uniref:Uncharacterized protein n=1 Tax=Pontibacillus salipaludis TaxID=1697394 RepID=A0ABQ1QLH2_9BACI|nr:hypothetical protein [Pontibacillus salipaludis]GGD29626.1 hypothetical protein GCM10011389_41480 [Pontibacillus salipaludis]
MKKILSIMVVFSFYAGIIVSASSMTQPMQSANDGEYHTQDLPDQH